MSSGPVHRIADHRVGVERAVPGAEVHEQPRGHVNLVLQEEGGRSIARSVGEIAPCQRALAGRERDILTLAGHPIAVDIDAVGQEVARPDGTRELQVGTERARPVEVPHFERGRGARDSLVVLRLLLIRDGGAHLLHGAG